MHSYTQIPTPPFTETQTCSANNPTEGSICLGTRWPCCLGACEQAQWRPLILHTPSRLCWADDGWRGGGGWGVRGITTPCYRSFKTLFRKPPEIAPFTPRTDGAKSLLVTQSHAVNRWSSYWVKDRAGRGGSSSIPAGNNGAAGQECRLQEEGSGRRSMLQHSRAMQALWNWRNWENLFFRMKGGGEEARGCVWGWLSGIKLRLRVLVCESGTAVFVFNLQTRTKRHLPVCTLFAGSEETQPRGLTRIQGPTVTDTRSSSCTKSCTSGTDNFIVDKKKKKHCSEALHTERRENLYHCKQLQRLEDIFS